MLVLTEAYLVFTSHWRCGGGFSLALVWLSAHGWLQLSFLLPPGAVLLSSPLQCACAVVALYRASSAANAGCDVFSLSVLTSDARLTHPGFRREKANLFKIGNRKMIYNTS